MTAPIRNAMTEATAALACLIEGGNGGAELAAFYRQWQGDRLVLDKWFGLQVMHAPAGRAAAVAEALAAQSEDADLAAEFTPVAQALAEGEATILAELAAAQGPAAEIGGYFRPSVELKAKVMRPSATLNAIID